LKKLAPTLLVFLLTTLVARAEDRQPPIVRDEIKATIEKLAGEEFMGREAGSETGHKAGDWIASQAEKLGLKPAGDDGTYFQNFTQGRRKLRNVVATLPAQEGSEHADEVVVIGSHYDHLGKGGFGAMDFMSAGNKVHYGADDNASGSTGTLTLARAFAAMGPAKRRIVFVWFDGEELGLYGSKRYVKSPAFPLEKTVAMLNMDMIGRLRNDKLVIYGINTGSSFPDILKRASEGTDLKLDLHDAMPNNSDHWSFYSKKVPVVALFTGLHKDYHRATDTVDKIELDGMVRVLRLAYGIVHGIADAGDRPVYAKAKDGQAEAMVEQIASMIEDSDMQRLFGGEDGLWKTFKEGGLDKVMEKVRGLNLFGGGRGGAANRPRFGIGTQETEDQKGVKVSEVHDGSVAARAGVHADDVIVEFDGKPIGDYESLTTAIRQAKGKIKLAVERDGKRVELEADFGAQATKRWL